MFSSYKDGPSAFNYDIETGNLPYDSEDRNNFIRKVFGLLSIQLLITVVMGSIIVGASSVKNWVYHNPWIFWLAFFASLALLITLTCNPEMANSYPTNLGLLFGFTVCEGFLVGTISAAYNIDEIVLAAGITVGITICLTLFAMQTKIDFTMFSGILFSCLVALVLTSFILIFVPKNRVVTMVLCGLGAMLFSAYLVYDVQMIAGGRNFEFGYDNYITATLMVYLDIINLFLFILRLVNGGGRG